MFHIAICDDEPKILSLMEELLQELMAAGELPCCISCFQNWEEMVVQKDNYDIFFIDIHLGEDSGFQIAKKLQIPGQEKYIIFITADEEAVYNVFDLEFQPFYFLQKRSREQMKRNLQKVISKLKARLEYLGTVTVELESGKKREIELKQVVYIESQRNYISEVLY